MIDKTDSGQLHNSLIKCVFDQWCKVIAVTILQIIFPIILAWLAWHTRSVQLEIASDRVSQQFYILKPNLSKVRPQHWTQGIGASSVPQGVERAITNDYNDHQWLLTIFLIVSSVTCSACPTGLIPHYCSQHFWFYTYASSSMKVYQTQPFKIILSIHLGGKLDNAMDKKRRIFKKFVRWWQCQWIWSTGVQGLLPPRTI